MEEMGELRGDWRGEFWRCLSTAGSMGLFFAIMSSIRLWHLMINETGQSLEMIISAGTTVPILINRDSVALDEFFYLIKGRPGDDHVELITATSKGSPFFDHIRFIH